MIIKIEKTPDGIVCAEFKDAIDGKCLIQKSSLMMSPFIFMGVCDGDKMLLTREQVAELIPLLQKFVDTGELE